MVVFPESDTVNETSRGGLPTAFARFAKYFFAAGPPIPSSRSPSCGSFRNVAICAGETDQWTPR